MHIGICSSIAAGFLRELIQSFLDQNTCVGIEIHDLISRKYIALLRKGYLDVAFTVGRPDVPACETGKLWTERLFAVLPQEHPVARNKELDWKALCDERFILPDTDLGRAIEEHFSSESESQPKIHRFDVGHETALHLVALGLGLSLTTEAATASCYPGVEFRRIAGAENVIPFSGVWSPNNDNPAFRRFLSLARILSKK